MATTPDGTPFVEPGDSIAAYPTVSQELAAVIDSLRTMIPAGAIFPYAGKTAPEGYLMCDGKAYTRADFYDLYEVMSDWVGEWGGFPGGNSAQFFVPDFRGRSPIGIGNPDPSIDPTNNDAQRRVPVRVNRLGERVGDWRIPYHEHTLWVSGVSGLLAAGTGGLHGGSVPAWATSTPTGGIIASARSLLADPDNSYTAGNQQNTGDLWGPSGVSRNIHPSTGVNFIIWTATTTAGKNPVPGVELAPVTTRMMIEARLEEAGIGEEQIEMLREQLAALKEDTDG